MDKDRVAQERRGWKGIEHDRTGGDMIEHDMTGQEEH